MIQAAQGATKKRGSFYRAKYNALRFRLGSANKTKVAIANRIARTIDKVLGGKTYKDIGYMRGDPREGLIDKHVRKLRALGVDIKHVNHQMIHSVNKVAVNSSGIIKSQ